MMQTLVALVPLFPLAGFLLTGLLRNRLSRGAAGTIACGAVLASFVISLVLFQEVRGGARIETTLFPFITAGDLIVPFAFVIDPLSSLFLLVITGVGFLIHLYSTAYMHEETPPHFARYFSYLNLFVFSMLLLVMGSNFVILFIGWEGVGLCSYLLIGFWFRNRDYSNAAKKAFIMNRIGDFGFLIAMFWMIVEFGALDFATVFGQAAGMEMGALALTGITLLLFLGATGKSAQIPLYTWLPDAMAGPTPVSALIHAATMVTAGIYMIARSNILYTLAPFTQAVVAIVGLATAIFAATIALKQYDIKKVLAYSTVSQLGYMFLGLGVGAYTGAVFHVMTHAFFKALLFLGAGSVIHALHHEQDIRNMGGLRKKMPVTHFTFLAGCLAIAGIPPLSGFFSKDEILAAAWTAGPLYWLLGVAAALMTAWYMFRLYAMTFGGAFRGGADRWSQLHESPRAMTIPLILLAILSVAGGWVGIPELMASGAHRLGDFLAPVFAESEKLVEHHHPDHQTEWILVVLTLAGAGAAALLAWRRYSIRPDTDEPHGLGKALYNKWYVDEIYDQVIVRPLFRFAGFLNLRVERGLIDRIVNSVGRLVQYGGRQLRWMQSGQVASYILLMVLGMLIFFVIQIFIKS